MGICDTQPISKKVLVFVNPVSGDGSSLQIWTRDVRLMLIDAQRDFECIITERANHAREFVESSSHLSEYSLVLTVGGDGIMYEVLQGVMSRADRERVIESLAVMPIPGGSGNGLAKSILFQSGESYSAVNMAFLALRGQPRYIDMALVQ